MKRIVIVVAMIVALVFPTMMASAQTGTWMSGINIQNIDTIEASVVVEFYDPVTGSLVYTYPSDGSEATIEVGGNINVYVPSLTGLADGRYSAVISSNARVAAVVNTQNRTETIGDSYLGIEAPSDNVVAPLVYRNYHGYTTTLYVQNPNDSSVSPTISLMQAGSSTATVTKTLSAIPAYASAMVDLSGSDYAAFEGKYGSAFVDGNGDSVAVIALYVRNTGTTASKINGQYRALSVEGAGREWYAPIVYKNHNGWVTGINVVNTEAVSTTVRAVYTASAQSAYAGTVVTDTITLGPNAMGVFYTPSTAALPASAFYGAAYIYSDSSDVQVIINNTNYQRSEGSVAAAYEGIDRSVATDEVAAPLIYRSHANSDTGFNVMNVGDAATNITLTVTKSPASNPTGTGAPGPWTFTVNNVPAGGAATFYLPSLMPTVSSLYGSAVISSSNGEELIAVVTSSSYPRGFSGNYVGIGY
jgi:hypothetical protein